MSHTKTTTNPTITSPVKKATHPPTHPTITSPAKQATHPPTNSDLTLPNPTPSSIPSPIQPPSPPLTISSPSGLPVREAIQKDGYVVVSGLFPTDVLHALRQRIMAGVRSGAFGLANKAGVTIPAFIKLPALRDLGIALRDHPRLHAVLRDIFGGDDYRFCAHNDVGVNRTVSWHKDRLNGKYRRFERHDIFGGTPAQRFEIVKVLTYLEDHTADDHALMLIPGSHRRKAMGDPAHGVRLHPAFGDTVIFDQRISHKGQGSQVRDAAKRILVSFGFGKNNVYTDEFEKGTKKRQRDQFQEMMRGKKT